MFNDRYDSGATLCGSCSEWHGVFRSKGFVATGHMSPITSLNTVLLSLGHTKDTVNIGPL